jgi:hypothetical protein
MSTLYVLNGFWELNRAIRSKQLVGSKCFLAAPWCISCVLYTCPIVKSRKVTEPLVCADKITKIIRIHGVLIARMRNLGLLSSALMEEREREKKRQAQFCEEGGLL